DLVMKRILFLLSMLVPFGTSMLYGQQFSIKGRVTNTVDNSPLVGATVLVKGSEGQSTKTNEYGLYAISVNQDDVLMFQYVGMRPVERAVAGLSSIDVSLEQEIEILEDVVVVGYGTQRRSDLTSSVSSVRGDQISSQAIRS